MRALLTLLALALGACAPKSPEYHRGTLVRPPPAQARPGVGAPTYDPQAKPLPPQPQPKPARVLPQTPTTAREPGIWASDAASSSGVQVLGVPIPLTDEEHKSDPRSPHMRRCALELAIVANGIPGFLPGELDRLLGEDGRRCLAATVHAACMDHRYEQALREREAQTGAAFKAASARASAFGAATREARGFRARNCGVNMMNQFTFPSSRDALLDLWRSQFGSAPWWSP
jgi:hypothetical protein